MHLLELYYLQEKTYSKMNYMKIALMINFAAFSMVLTSDAGMNLLT